MGRRLRTIAAMNPTALNRFTYPLMCFFAFGVAGYAAVAYGLLPLGSTVDPDMRLNFLAHRTGISLHIAASTIALVLGPLQFSARLRQRHTQVHRWLGRIYLGVGVLVGGTAGLYMARFAFGGLAAQAGFAMLALAWLYTGLRAYLSIRRGAVDEHRRWMVRNFALTLAAVTLRLYMPLGMVSGIPFEVAYPVIAWLCWVPNLLVAQWMVDATGEKLRATSSRGAG